MHEYLKRQLQGVPTYLFLCVIFSIGWGICIAHLEYRARVEACMEAAK